MTDGELVETVYDDISTARENAGFPAGGFHVSIVASGGRYGHRTLSGSVDAWTNITVTLYVTLDGRSTEISASTNEGVLAKFRSEYFDTMQRQWGCADVDLLALGM